MNRTVLSTRNQQLSERVRSVQRPGNRKGNKACVALFAVIATLAIPTLIDASSSTQVEKLGSLVVPRTGHTATALSDGRILITGGRDSARNIVAVSEIFNPATQVSTASATLTTARIDHTATLLRDGRVLVAGGTGATGPLSSAEMFDPSNPAAGFRVLSSNMSTARARHTATLLNSGKVLIAGGDAAGTAEIFDPATESFSPTLWNLAVPRTGHTATLFSDDSVLLAGGNTDSMELFTPADQKFTLDSQQMSAVRTGHSALELSDTRLLFFEGDTGNTVDEFNPSTDTLTLKDTLDAPVSSATLLANGKVLLLGRDVAGLYDPNAAPPTPSLTVFDETAVPNSSTLLRTGQTATEIAGDKKILVAGGVDAQNLWMGEAIFNPAKIWTDKDDYLPDEPVLLYGSGWKPNEDVYLYAVDSETEQWTYGSTARADTNGAFAVEPYFIVQMRHLGTTFDVTAVGALSKLQADVTFTDAAKPTSTVTFPANNGSYNTAGWNAGASSKITGTASFASGSTGRIVQVSVKQNSTGKYWSGSGSTFNGVSENFVNATLVGTSWSVNFPASNFTADGTYVVHSLATDSNGQENGAGGVATFTFDNTGPAAPSAPVLASGSNSGSNADQITNVNTPNFVGTAEANSTITIFDGATQIASGTTASNGNYNIGPSTVLSDGAHTITAKASDAAGNQSPASGSTSVTIDTVRPSLTINQASGQSDPTSTSPINFTVIFSESVTGFTAPSVHLSGTAGATTAVVTGSGATYNVAVTGMTTSGTVIATIAQNAAQDTAANGNTASTSTDNSVTYNACTSPSITTDPTSQTVTYGAASASFSAAADGNPAPTVQWQLSVNNGAFTDIAGATNTTYTISNPTVAMSGNKYRAVFTNSCNSGTATTNEATLTVNKANASFNVTGYTATYDGQPHTATGTATGVNGEDLSSLLNLSGTTHTDVGTYNDTWTFAGNNNYNAKTDGTVSDKINAATATVQLSNLKQTYDGTAKSATATTTPSGLNVTITYKDANNNPVASPTNAASYAVTATINDSNYTGSATGTLVIAKASSTTTVNVSNATYDGSPHGGTASVIGAGGLGQSLTVHYVGRNGTTYASSTTTPTHAGDYTASASYLGDDNHDSSQDSQDYTVNKANATVVVTPYSVTYDGNAHTASGTATGVGGVALTGLDLSGTTHTNAGSYTDTWTFTDTTGNYKDASSTIADKIGKADATISVDGYTGIYDGNAHGGTGSAKGVNNEDLSSSLDLGQKFTDVPGGTANWTFNGGTNYNSASGTAAITISKAEATITVNGYTGTYDGNAHGAAGAANGVKGENLDELLGLGEQFTDVPGGTAHWSFAGNGNYKSANGTANIVISKANAVVHVDGYTGVYDGDPHGATGSARGVKNEDLSSLLHLGSSFTNVPGGTANWTFDGNGNYNADAGTAVVAISKANATIQVDGYTGIYDGDAHSATGSAKGVKNEDLSALLHLGSSFTNVPGGTANWTFDGNGNYNSDGGSAAIVISKANAMINVDGYTGVYDGDAHGATGSAKGVKDEDLSTLLHLGASFIDVPGGTANWTFDGNGNYNTGSGAATIVISKANATISVEGYTGVYDGDAHGATGSAKGVKNEDLSALLHLGDNFTNVPGGTANWTFDGNGNYNSDSGTAAIVISKANATIVVTPYEVTYDGDGHAATGSAKGVKGESLAGLDLSGTTHINAGDYIADSWTFTDATGNYNNATSAVHDKIAKADANITVTPYAVTYDGDPHIATGSAKGVKNENLSGLNLSATNHTDAGTYTDSWTFTDVTGNYNNASSTVVDSIAKAKAVISVTPYHVTYDGSQHAAVGSATGVKGENLANMFNLTGTAHTNAGTYNDDPWSFAGNVNYNSANGTVDDSIGKADAQITVNGYTGVYDGQPHAASGSATGVETSPANLTSLLHLGNSFTNVPGGTAHWTFEGDSNYNGATGDVAIVINKAALVVKADDKQIVLNASLPLFTVTYTGFVPGESASNLGGTLAFTPTSSPSAVGTYPITPSGLTSNNYSITFVVGMLTVKYAASGLVLGSAGHAILQPINTDASSVFKSGSTVPAKFRVGDAAGNSIGTPGVVTSFRLIAKMTDKDVTVNEDVSSTTPDTVFRWDPTGMLWIFNISTKGMAPATKYTYLISLNDGSSIQFTFALR